jgi:hypothetical protein
MGTEMPSRLGTSVKPLAAALALALGAGGIGADAATPANPALATRMQALHDAMAQLKHYRATHPGKLTLLPNSHPHKVTFPRHRNAPTAVAATIAVTSCTDNASSATTPGTLRYAVLNVAENDTIDLSACNASTITLTQGALPISVDNLTITAGAGNHVTIDGGGTDRVIYDQGPGTTAPAVLALRYLTLQNGKAPVVAPTYAGGGCVLASNDGVALYHSTITGCRAESPTGPAVGGGIASYALYMYRSSITGNGVSSGNGAPPNTSGTAPIAVGGGAFAKYGTYIINSHIDGNTVTSASAVAASGGGLAALAPYLSGSTISNNVVQMSVGNTTSGIYLGVGGGLSAKYGGTLQASTISGNRLTCSSTSTTTPNAVCFGAGVAAVYNGRSSPGATFSIDYSTISGNSAACSGNYSVCLGGGMQSKYPLDMVQSTITGNSSQVGGGILLKYLGGGGAYVYNSTIAANTATLAGAGLYDYVGGGVSSGVSPITLVSSIVAKNNTAGVPDDIYLSNSYTLSIGGSNNLVEAVTANFTLPVDTLSADPLLGPLANNGGPTQTMGLLAGSPALGAGSNPNGYTNDQRGPGFPRTVGGLTDIGSFQGIAAAAAAPVPAPALSTWALALLAGLLGLIGWRRRQTG